MRSRPVIGVGLVLASAGSGCLDILCYRYLGEVFPSAMTGNLALLGRSLGELDLQAAGRNMSAFGGFFAGLLIGAALLRGTPARLRFLFVVGLQAAVLFGFAWFWATQSMGLYRLALIGAASVGMGLQSAVAYRLGVHAVTATYFTGTTANIAFGLVSPGKPERPAGERIGWPTAALVSHVSGAALSGWYIAAHGFPSLPVGFAALPFGTTLCLAVAVAACRLPPKPA